MKIETCIKERRSVRKFSDEEVSKEVINEIIDLTRYSPSWKNTQVVRYHVVKNQNKKEDIGNHCFTNFAFNGKTVQRSNALIVVTVVKGISGYEKDGSFTTSQEDNWEAFDAGIAAQTFCLAAHSKGVGSVILGIFDEKEILKQIEIPDNEEIKALIAIGYPLEDSKSAPPRKEVEELIKYI